MKTQDHSSSIDELLQMPFAFLKGKEPRILEEGQPITMDYHENRMNIEIDTNKLISKIWLG